MKPLPSRMACIHWWSKDPDGNLSVRVIGSIVEYLYAPADPTSVISKMSDPGVKIISLTITEGGYNYDTSTGRIFIFGT